MGVSGEARPCEHGDVSVAWTVGPGGKVRYRMTCRRCGEASAHEFVADPERLAQVLSWLTAGNAHRADGRCKGESEALRAH